MKILQLSPRFVLPDDDGGKISIYNITKFLAELGAKIWFAFYHNDDYEEKYLQKLEEYCVPIPIKHSTRNSLPRIISSAIRNKSIYLEKHFFKPAIKILSNYIEKNGIEIIHSDHSAMMPLALELKRIYNLPIGLRLHNVEFKIWQRYAENLHGFNPKKLYIKKQANLLKQKEIEFFNQADINFPITDVDAEVVKKYCIAEKVKVVRAGVDLNKFKISDEKRNPKEIILATGYSWIHNLDGLKWFLENCFEKIVKEIEDVLLTLIGKDMPNWLKNLKHKNIRVLGYVEDVVPYFNKASVYITPLFVGSGVRIKILEAMAMELPVVATSIAGEGIEATEQDGLFLADNPDEFSSKLIKLLKNIDDTDKIRKKARMFVEKNHTWKKSVSIIYNEYLKLSKKNNNT